MFHSPDQFSVHSIRDPEMENMATCDIIGLIGRLSLGSFFYPSIQLDTEVGARAFVGTSFTNNPSIARVLFD